MSHSIDDAPEEAGELNVTPLVDVALVLVIIFMVTAPLMHQPTLPVKLPLTSANETKEPVQIAVTLSPDGRMALNEKVLNEEALFAGVEQALAEEPDSLVVLRADRSVDATRVVALAKRLRTSGARRIAIGADAEPKPKARG